MSGPSLHRLTLRGSLEEIKTIIQVRRFRDSKRQRSKKLKCMHDHLFAKNYEQNAKKKSVSISLTSTIRFYQLYPDIKVVKRYIQSVNIFRSQNQRSHYCTLVWGHACDTRDVPQYPHLVPQDNLQLGEAAYIVFQVHSS